MRTLAYWLSLALIFTIPWETVVQSPALGSASRMIGLAAAACWGVTVLITGRLREPSPLHLGLLLFIVWNAASIFWSANVDRTFEHVETWTQLFIMTYIFWDLYTTRASLIAGLQMYVLGGYVVFGSAVSNYLSGNTYYYERFSAAGTNPDDLGVFLALGIPVAWYLALSRSTYKMAYLSRWVNFAYILIALTGIGLSSTRTALVAAVPGMLFGLASLNRLRLSMRIVGFLLFTWIAFSLLPLIPQESLQRLSTTSSEVIGGDLNGRKELWSQGLASFAERPLLGVGSIMYRTVNIEGKVAHNSFISVLVELGLLGFVLFAIILLTVCAQVVRHAKWDMTFWLSVLTSWAIAASTLTLEHRKPTWLFLTLVSVSASLIRQRNDAVQAVPRDRLKTQVI